MKRVIQNLLEEHREFWQALNLKSPINFESGQPGAHRAAANAVETRAGCTRELLARRIIEMAERGERDPRRLVDDALLHFADLKAR